MTDRCGVRCRLLTAVAGILVSTAATWAVCSPAAGAVHTAFDPVAPGSGLLGTSPAGAAGSLGQGVTSIASSATTDLALSAVESWVSGGATFVLHETATVLGETTTPRLDSTWFSAVYWKVAGLAAMLTLPFLFAAAIQALIRSDLTLLLRAALGYLPLAMLAVAVTAPLTMLLLSASDELAGAVSSAAGNEGVSFLEHAISPLGTVGSLSGSPFLLFLLGLFTVAGALMLWIELLMREAAVYVIVLMLPLAFAALVWPARRIWAIRSVEVLAALILSKFAIVAVLSLGGLALGHSLHTSFAAMLSGLVLLILGAFTPWALLRLLPLAELASGAAGALRGQSGATLRALQHADGWATEAHRWATTTAHMRRSAGETPPASSTPARPRPPETERAEDRDGEEGAQAPPAAATAAPASAAEGPAPTPKAPPPPPEWILHGKLALEPEELAKPGDA